MELAVNTLLPFFRSEYTIRSRERLPSIYRREYIMPRKRSEAHIWLDPVRRSWTILDGRKRVRTGCFENEELEALEALRKYLYHEKCKKDNNPPPRRLR